ncbi:MAG: SoxR reducing system RseC family protein, partial [Oscillospiraceae bacterium]
METTGIIVNINKDTFTVKVDRKSSCGGNCVSCKGCPSETLFLQLKGKYKYSIGDTVILEMPTKNFLFSSFLGY